MIQIKKLRTQAGMRQSDLAEMLGVSKFTVSVRERGCRMPEWATIQKICGLFHVSVQDLIGEEIPSEEDLKIIDDDFIEQHEVACLRNALIEACGIICSLEKAGDRYTLAAELVNKSACQLLQATEVRSDEGK